MRATKLLDATAELVRRNAETPPSAEEARDLLGAVHDMDGALDLLHEAAGCVAPLDRHHRCTGCGRLVNRGGTVPHEKRGCASLVPILGQWAWLKAHTHLIYSIPYAGKALFLVRRSLATVSPQGSGGERRGRSVSHVAYETSSAPDNHHAGASDG